MSRTWLRVLGILSLVVVLGLACQLAAVGQVRGGVATINYKGTTVADPDPHKASTQGETIVAAMLADPLVRWEDNAVVGVLAASWEVAPDGLTYTLHLRDGVKFHNGVALTAEAVKKNIQRIVDPANALFAAGSLANVDTVEAPDAVTVVFKMKKVDPNFLAKLGTVYIIEPGSLAGRGQDDPVAGSGPFKLVKGQYQRDQKMTLDKFKDYWGGEPYLDQIVVRLIPDDATSLIELEKGTIDFAQFIPATDVARLQKAGFQVFIFGFVNWNNVAVNLKTVTDVALRKAMCYAIDSQAIVDGIYAGLGTVMTTIAYPGTSLENTEIRGYTYNPAMARYILDVAGYKDTNGDGIREKDGKPIDLYFPTRNRDDWLRATQLIQQMFKDVGIGSHITVAERTPFYDQVRTGNYDIAWWLQNAPAGVAPIALYSWDARDYWYIGQAQLPLFQALIEAAETQVDQLKRDELYKEIQQIFYDEAYGVLGMWSKQPHAASPKLHGVVVAPTGIAYKSHLWWKDAK